MIRLILVVLLLLLSLLTVFKAPTNFLWYVSIIVTEFPWMLILVTLLLLGAGLKFNRYNRAINTTGIAALVLFTVPIAGAYKTAAGLHKDINNSFSTKMADEKQASPFGFWRMITGINATAIGYQVILYDSTKNLSLDFYPSQTKGARPCVVVVHGGSWSAGDSRQLPELNSELSKKGYHVASVNYRLVPQYTSPAPVEDLHAALIYLKTHASELNIDTGNFILLGRSAGGQIVLVEAYTGNIAGLRGVISFYGPTDMVWGYQHPSNPLVLNSCKIMEDYLGGTYSQVPHNYVNSSATVAVNNVSVPTLLIHGQNDPLVAFEHCNMLSKKLKENKVSFFVLNLPWATHGCDYTLNGPSGQLSTYTVEQFLHLVTR